MPSPLVKCAFAFVLFAAVFTSAQAPVQRTTTAPTSPPAVWFLGWGNMFGITQANFDQMGMSQLSKDQLSALFRQLLSARPNFSCSKFYDAVHKEEFKHVHIYVVSESDASMEFVGRLRSKLSAINDVTLVYSDQDADVVVSALGLTTHLEGGRETGFVASTIIVEPCTYQATAGFDKGVQNFRNVLDHYVNVGSEEERLASIIANDINGHDLDDIRRNHAAMLKLYQ